MPCLFCWLQSLGLGSAAASSRAELAAATAPSSSAAACETALGEVERSQPAAAAGRGSLAALMGGGNYSSSTGRPIADASWQLMARAPQQVGTRQHAEPGLLTLITTKACVPRMGHPAAQPSWCLLALSMQVVAQHVGGWCNVNMPQNTPPPSVQ